MYLNNTNLIVALLVVPINIITHSIFMKIGIVHTLRADWL